ncbi:CHAT domain-containing protein [Candidatus Synechococcus calcipolaris G9]|uniref:CHAT domain-containing protein n=1 Tax=Candidatus Synechococcus calcipolaris G9 TaxID=1497997 RepID=A0ABT6EUX5_9SYNE|nr:CHAT domain-containing protein [Candidatus Synechococcus calcipolaris]MDG2989641.1 CHAT domain-containing protein [Candidatus Synechococcus calcipolaris G9]
MPYYYPFSNRTMLNQLIHWLARLGAIAGAHFILSLPAQAQIAPALNGTNTTVTVNGQQFDIGGGAFSGDGQNLFHLLREFNLNEGQIANFLSNPQVRNILTGVNGGNPSYINGLLQVTGGNSNLFLLNPAGIVFGPNASLNVPAAFHASTAQRVHFDGGVFDINGVNDYANLLGNPTGFEFLNTGIIINEGNLAVGAGQNLSLMGHQVINTGTLSAPGGTITIQAVPETGMVRISQEGMLLSLEIPADRIPADGIIQAVDLPRLITGGPDRPRVNSVVHNDDGTISLIHDPTKVPMNRNTAVVGGTLDVSSGTGLGGQINVLGENIALINAQFDASGILGGGTMLIGGDYLGGSTGTNRLDSSFNAQNLFINPGSSLNADALNLGDGGTVIAWADNATQFHGFISARGGPSGGDGGFVETSGKQFLSATGMVDASSPLGNAGMWLLDPTDIEIVPGVISLNITAGPVFGADPIISVSSQLGAGLINAALDLGTNVTVTTTSDGTAAGNIVVNAPIIQTLPLNATLTLNANNNIEINQPITFSGFGNLILNSGGIVTQSAPITNLSAVILGGSGSFFLTHSGNQLNSLEGTGTISGSVNIVNNSGLLNIEGLQAASISIETTGILQGNSLPIQSSSGGINIQADSLSLMSTSPLTANGGGSISINTINNISLGGGGTGIQTNGGGNINIFSGQSIIFTSIPDGVKVITNSGGNINLQASNLIQLQSNDDVAPDKIHTLGTGDITLRANTILTTAESIIQGSGKISFLPNNFSSPITIGDGPVPPGALHLNSLVLGAIQPGFNQIVIGAMDGTGVINVETLVSPLNTNLRLNTQAGIGINSPLNLGSFNLTLNGGGLVTQNSPIIVTGLELLGGGTFNLMHPGNNIMTLAANTSGAINLNTGSGLNIGMVDGTFGVNTNDNILNLMTGGNLTQTAPIQTGSLGLTVNGSVSLNNPNNQINILAAQTTGNFSLVNSNEIIVGSVNPSGINSGGNVFLQTLSGNIILNQPIAAAAGGDSIVLVAGTNFINNAGTSALSAPNGRWLVYSTDPANNILGGLLGSEQFSTIFPGGANFSGSGFLYRVGGPVSPPPAPTTESATTPPPKPTLEEPILTAENVFGDEINRILFGQEEDNLEEIDETITEIEQEQVTGSTTFFPGVEFAREQIANALDQGDFNTAVEWLERLYTHEFSEYFQEIFTTPGSNTLVNLSINNVQSLLMDIGQQTGQTPALLYTFIRPGQLDILVVTPSGEPIYIPVREANQEALQQVMNAFNREVKDPSKTNTNSYLPAAQQLYQWMIEPLNAELQARGIDTLLLSMDEGFRTLPMAALHSGGFDLISSAVSDTPMIVATGNGQFLIETYNLGLIPSINLIDTQFQSIQTSRILAMGASEFTTQSPLPAVPVELEVISQQLGGGSDFLNQAFTVSNLESQRRRGSYNVIHLATHGEFNAGSPSNSYIQFWNSQLSLSELRDIRLNRPPTELLTLSACRTAVGSREAELGFAGLALQAGVKSAAASLWYVSDEGTLALMTEFYNQLETAPIKAEAMRQAQLAMVRGEVTIEGDRLRGSGVRGGEGIVLPQELMIEGSRNLSHPYFWSAFTLIGSPW